MLETSSELISAMLNDTVNQFDIPPEQRNAATAEYKRVGNWLAANDDSGFGWAVYPQGSFQLNTVVRPTGADEYDVDAVCRREIDKSAITQASLKAKTGDVLDQYRRAVEDLPGAPTSLKERNRCWTLGYPRSLRFHLDTLPAIPNPEGGPTGILITDPELRNWQKSDPLGYANWFRKRAESEFLTKRARLAEASHTPPEEIPDWRISTTLHQTVQALKVHRNEHFKANLDQRPASILVTTLVAHAYTGAQDLYSAIVHAADTMPEHITKNQDGFWVPNPVEHTENFADRWNTRPELAESFYGWLEKLRDDLAGASDERGLNRVATRLQEGFGSVPISVAAGRLGDNYRKEREKGNLSFSPASGMLTVGTAGLPVRQHDFYGDVSTG